MSAYLSTFGKQLVREQIDSCNWRSNKDKISFNCFRAQAVKIWFAIHFLKAPTLF